MVKPSYKQKSIWLLIYFFRCFGKFNEQGARLNRIILSRVEEKSGVINISIKHVKNTSIVMTRLDFNFVLTFQYLSYNSILTCGEFRKLRYLRGYENESWPLGYFCPCCLFGSSAVNWIICKIFVCLNIFHALNSLLDI